MMLGPLLAASLVLPQTAPPVIPLWIGGAPGFETRRTEPEEAKDWWVKNIHNPSITVFLPPKEIATGTGIVIVPGGGHSQLVFGPEGVEPARFLNKLGIACFVLKHRLAREANSPYKIEVHARQDGYRALRTVRARAAEWGVKPDRIGILGFSAGAEVVGLVSYDAASGNSMSADLVERQSGKPNFAMSIYPGPIGFPAVIPPDAPPSFFLVSNDDEGHANVVVDLIPKYRAAKVPLEVHLYAKGGHGYNLGERSNLATIRNWPQRMVDWLIDMGYANPSR